MALPACFHLADEVFPHVRARAAKALVGAGWTQSRAADALGVSQAMVSNYLGRQDADDPIVARLADDLIDALTTGNTTPSWCALLERDPADPALADLLAAESRLLAANPVSLVPEIGLNIARIRGEEVLSYPGRLIRAGPRILRPAAPAVDDGHLPRCLRAANVLDPQIQAMANIAGTPRIAAAARRAGLELAPAEQSDDHDARFIKAWRPGTAVHDPGAVGVEACIYLTAPDAGTLIDLILRIASEAT